MNNVKCPICKSAEYKIIYPSEKTEKKLSYSPSNSLREFGPVVKCSKCKVVFKTNFPDKEELKEGYEENIDTQYLQLLEERRESFKEILNFIEKYSKRGKILDIGCGEGTLLELSRQRGWDVTGVEPNKNFVLWAEKNYKIKILQGSVDNEHLKENYYDVITLLDVIEHVPYPLEFLRRCNELLREEGIIFISTPDFGSLPSRIMKKKWFYILHIHLFYFTKKTFSLILKKTGFRVIKIKPYYLKTSLNYILNKSQNYMGRSGRFLHKLFSILGLNRLKMKYWLGQSIFIAKKSNNKE